MAKLHQINSKLSTNSTQNNFHWRVVQPHFSAFIKYKMQ